MFSLGLIIIQYRPEQKLKLKAAETLEKCGARDTRTCKRRRMERGKRRAMAACKINRSTSAVMNIFCIIFLCTSNLLHSCARCTSIYAPFALQWVCAIDTNEDYAVLCNLLENDALDTDTVDT